MRVKIVREFAASYRDYFLRPVNGEYKTFFEFNLERKSFDQREILYKMVRHNYSPDQSTQAFIKAAIYNDEINIYELSIRYNKYKEARMKDFYEYQKNKGQAYLVNGTRMSTPIPIQPTPGPRQIP